MRQLHETANALWYKDAVIYELHVRSFADGNGDGIGDFRGLIQKLDYLRDLGVTAIWLLPFYPSPLKDDGYDIADYTGVNPAYGTLSDFKRFLHEAHERGLKVITELVLNHTSDQHVWFQRARRSAPGSAWRNFYVWSDTSGRYREARIIFKDFEQSNWSWDPTADAYFWHRFYSHQPDLNFENPAVWKALCKVLDFWLRLGVDGLRLDAVPYLIEEEGTGCENLPGTHAVLKRLREYVDSRYEDRMLLAEANQWPEDAAAYFGRGDECHMAFHFPLMPRMFMALRMEDRFPILDILDQTPAIPPNCQWALFLRNHDELTLEMVTDEERDYMYRVYASDPEARVNLGIRRRLAPLLGNNRRRIELMNSLLFSLPGTPVIYYGDEIGMGDNVYLGDRNGVRTPMQWSADRNAGFSGANPQRLFLPPIVDPEYHHETVHVEGQQSNPSSMLWWIKRLIALRKSHKAFARGSLELLHPDNRRILAFLRSYEDQHMLVVANLSRFVQYVELNLGQFRGMVPVETFGHTEFPPIGDLPYLLTLGPHSFYWFAIEPSRVASAAAAAGRDDGLPTVALSRPFEEAMRERALGPLHGALARYLQRQRWFGGKGRTVGSVSVVDAIPLPSAELEAHVALVRVEYAEGDPETYALPLAAAPLDKFGTGERQDRVAVARLESPDGDSPLLAYDPTWDRGFGRALLEAIAGRRRLRGSSGWISGASIASLRAPDGELPEPTAVLHFDQSNRNIVYGNQFILKLLGRVENGISIEVEIGRYLAERGFLHTPRLLGTLEYRRPRGEAATLALLQSYVPNEGDAWKYTLDALQEYFEGVLARGRLATVPPVPPNPWVATTGEPPPIAAEAIGSYSETARLLGVRTADLHRVLAMDSADPAFAPEPFTQLYQRSLYQSLRSQAQEALGLLRRRLPDLPPAVVQEARALLDLERDVLAGLRPLLTRRFAAVRTRHHGDYHLGQVLYTGKDFVIIDFEGEPARSLEHRRIKRSPLRDVAGMLRSFVYATHAARINLAASGAAAAEEAEGIERWAQLWHTWVGAMFLRGYLGVMENTSILPEEPDGLGDLLRVLVVEKAVYELAYELNNRPDWVVIPIRSLVALSHE